MHSITTGHVGRQQQHKREEDDQRKRRLRDEIEILNKRQEKLLDKNKNIWYRLNGMTSKDVMYEFLQKRLEENEYDMKRLNSEMSALMAEYSVLS